MMTITSGKMVQAPPASFTAQERKEISRLVAAAVVNPDFRRLLLADPARAVRMGFNGERFDLGADLTARLGEIRARSLEALVRQLIDEG